MTEKLSEKYKGMYHVLLNGEAPIKIKELQQLANEKDLQAIVILTVERNGAVSVVTYGENQEKCKVIGDWGQGLWKYAVSIIPFQTIFGWGNNGKPKLASIEQIAEHNTKVLERLNR